jgi:hypothetical protein
VIFAPLSSGCCSKCKRMVHASCPFMLQCIAYA